MSPEQLRSTAVVALDEPVAGRRSKPYSGFLGLLITAARMTRIPKSRHLGRTLYYPTTEPLSIGSMPNADPER
jgi:hypothetical protein